MSSKLTALRRDRPGRVALEVDGRLWRTVPDEVVVRVGLTTGMELERPVLRRLRSELHRANALKVAGRALARRDLSKQKLAARLDRAGVARDTAQATVATLTAAGAIDDARVAAARAAHLAERGWGDAAILARLECEGIDLEVASEAVRALPPERERAQALLAPGHAPRRAAQTLMRRGFAPETLEDLFPALDGGP